MQGGSFQSRGIVLIDANSSGFELSLCLGYLLPHAFITTPVIELIRKASGTESFATSSSMRLSACKQSAYGWAEANRDGAVRATGLAGNTSPGHVPPRAAACHWALGPQPSPRARSSRWRGTLEGIQALSGVACPQCGATMPFELPIRLDGIPWDVALCLYRVAQEILRNIATHAAAHWRRSPKSTEEGPGTGHRR